MLDAYLYDGLRTPFGRHAGSLAGVRPDDLFAGVIQALLARTPVPPDRIEDVIAGCTCQAGEDSRNVARHGGLLAGLPVGVAGQTVNRLCGSGLAAVLDAARACHVGAGSWFIAGGVESMSRAPFVLSKAESAYARDTKIYDTTMGARFPNPLITRQFGADSMPETADNIAADHAISRAASDLFAWHSQQKAARAEAAGIFAEEIAPVEIKTRSGTTHIARDEHPRPETALEKLGQLKPLFAGGTVTAGNASGINDGATALLVGSAAAGKAAGIAPIARVIGGAVAGVEPRVMGLGPVPAIQKLLARHELGLKDLDLIEINEAFATQVLGCAKLLGLAADDPRLNPNGGAIALGHPLGASGGRLAITGARHLARTGGRYGVLSMCIGIGQGIAVLIERV